GEPHRQLARRQRRLVECQLDDVVAHGVRNSVPHAIWSRLTVVQGLRTASAVPVVPAVEGRPRNAEFRQGVAHRQWGLLDQPNHLQLLGGRVSHVPSSPTPITLFFSSRFSSVSSATTSFNALASRRSSLTSSEVAARAVSPARRFLPASRNSFDQR